MKYLPYLPDVLLLWVVLFYSVGLVAGIWFVVKAASKAERFFALITLLGFGSSIVATVGLLGALPPQPVAAWSTIWVMCWTTFTAAFIVSRLCAR